jgi:hypothetical protein
MRSRLVPLFAVTGLVASAAAALIAASPAAAAPVSTAGTYVPVTPARVIDTRSGLGGHHGVIAAHGAIASAVGGHAHIPSTGVSSVAVTITVLSPTASGSLTAWATGTARTTAVNVSFAKGLAASDLAHVPVSTGGALDLYNGSTGSIQVVVDVSGYYRAGTPNAPGAYVRVAPNRVVDTRTGQDGNRKGAMGAGQGFSPLIGSHDGVPSSGVAAVAVTITAMSPTRSGRLLAYQFTGTKPGPAALQYVAGRPASAFAIVPVYLGRISLVNVSTGSVQVAVDVSGYILSGPPTTAGSFQVRSQQSIVDTRYGTGGNRKGALGPSGAVSVHIGGRGGVPINAAYAVLTVTDVSPTRSGGLTVWTQGVGRPGTTNLQFAAGQATSNVVIVPVSSSGLVDLYNASTGSTQVIVSVDGFLTGRTPTLPVISTGHYVRNITGGAGDMGTMNTEGCNDAKAGSTFVLLDIGAQSVTAPLTTATPGVLLTGTTDDRLTYGQLVTAIDGYLDGFAGCRVGSAAATVAVSTNNDGVFSGANGYAATLRGTDWAAKVIAPLRAHAASGITVDGANDIEAVDFSGDQVQAQQWESAYLANTSVGVLIYNGSADGCPTTFGITRGTCANGWTQANYYALAHNGARIQALPQVYNSDQGAQWANIDATGGGGITFAGSLTEHAAVPGTFTASQGWTSLYLALSTVTATPSLRASTDLRIDS